MFAGPATTTYASSPTTPSLISFARTASLHAGQPRAFVRPSASSAPEAAAGHGRELAGNDEDDEVADAQDLDVDDVRRPVVRERRLARVEQDRQP